MINFVEYDSEKVISELVSQFESVIGETLQPSDERRIFLNQLAQVIVLLKANINDTGNQVLLRTARGEALDAIGELFGENRLEAGYASCTLKFTLSAVQSTPITIPQGTRATPDGNIYFATDKALVIPAETLSGEVSATALQSGTKHNGYSIGQIKYIVDNVQYLSKVENTTESKGGTEREPDDDYRERIRLVPEKFSTAGCEDGYKFWAQSVAGVKDVSVTSPSAGVVNIYITTDDGSTPSAEFLATVNNAVSAKNRRPLTDSVEVKAPTTKDYSINFTYYIASENMGETSIIAENVSKAVQEYIAWQGDKIGRDINPDKLRNLILNAGASRVTMTSPAYTQIGAGEIASLTGSASITQEYDE